MMTDEMQDNFPFDPPPPPGEPAGASYRHWSPDPRWGPPSWPPAPHTAPRRSGLRRTLLAGFAIACVGAGGGTAWALTTTSIAHPTTGSPPESGEAPNSIGDAPNGVPSTGGTLSAAALAKIDRAVVDINADTASGSGKVAGTGMIITSNGEVLTNNHVIDNTVHITAQIDGTGTLYQVKVIGYDASDDVALVQLVGASNLPTIPLGDSSTVAPGDQITVVGNALGQGGTPAVTSGVVSQLDQQITASDESGDTETLTGMFQVSAAIQPGDSGGPEVNAAGQVVGMTTAGSTSGNPNRASGSTTGFAIPINKAMQVVAEIRSGSGPNIHIGFAALLGVGVQSGGIGGATVGSVQPNTPAATAGIVAGDVITKVGNTTIGSSGDLHKVMQGYYAGQSAVFTWTDPTTGTHSATITLGLANFPE